MNLFEIDHNFRLTFAPQALTLEPFKALWDRDKSKKKEVALSELAFIYFYTDFESDFSNILDLEERAQEVIDAVAELPKDWEPDKLIYEAIDFYEDRQQTVSMGMYDAAKAGMAKLKDHLMNIDLNERDEKGKLIHSISAYNKALKEMGDMVEALDKLHEQIKKEQQANEEMRGGRKKAIFEDGV